MIHNPLSIGAAIFSLCIASFCLASGYPVLAMINFGCFIFNMFVAFCTFD